MLVPTYLVGLALTLAIDVLSVASRLSATNSAMIIGALPLSLAQTLMGVLLVKAIVRDTIKDQEADSGKI